MANAVKAAALQLQQGRAVGGQWGRLYMLWKIFDAEPVNALAVVESVVTLTPAVVLGFALETFLHFGLWVKATSATTPDISVRILQSFDDVVGDYAVPEVNGIVAGSIADQNPHIFAVSPTTMPWLRYRLVGNAANPADSLVTVFAFHQMGE